jgi:hypothetical protein
VIALTCTFVLQQDRRQVADRRSEWRGGRRVTDFIALGERGSVITERKSAVIAKQTISGNGNARAVRAVVSA